MLSVLSFSITSPTRKNAVSSDTLAACCMLCVTTTTVYFFLSSSISSSTLSVDIGSRALVGSSMRSTSGETASARAMQRRCCCPPERPSADFLSLSFTSSNIAAPFRLSSTIWSSLTLFFIPCILGP